MTDPIADMLVRLKTALEVRKDSVDIPYSGLKEKIIQVLVAEGYLSRFNVLKRMNKSFIRVNLKYRKNKKGVIGNLLRISKPGRRIYSDARSLPRVEAGFGTAIISTSKGIMSDEQARAQKMGGEVLCYVW